MASLKDTIAKKDEEIERLQLLKDLKNGYPGFDGEQPGTGSLRYDSSSIYRPKTQNRLLGHTEKQFLIITTGFTVISSLKLVQLTMKNPK